MGERETLNEASPTSISQHVTDTGLDFADTPVKFSGSLRGGQHDRAHERPCHTILQAQNPWGQVVCHPKSHSLAGVSVPTGGFCDRGRGVASLGRVLVVMTGGSWMLGGTGITNGIVTVDGW